MLFTKTAQTLSYFPLQQWVFFSKNMSEPVCVPRLSTRDPATPGLRAGTTGKSGAIKLGTESWSESFAKSLRSYSQTGFRNSVRRLQWPHLTVAERLPCAGPGSSPCGPPPAAGASLGVRHSPPAPRPLGALLPGVGPSKVGILMPLLSVGPSVF